MTIQYVEFNGPKKTRIETSEDGIGDGIVLFDPPSIVLGCFVGDEIKKLMPEGTHIRSIKIFKNGAINAFVWHDENHPDFHPWPIGFMKIRYDDPIR